MTQRDRMSRRKLRAGSWSGIRPAYGLTLVEMLVAMAITLVMMAALVTVFANISGSVTRRRATIEMSSALRNVRDTLARDLAGATCPAVPWQRPESNVGYLELIEGPYNDYYPSPWLWDGPDSDLTPDAIGNRPGIDLTVSSLPGSNLRSPATPDEEEGRGRVLGSNEPLVEGVPTDGRGLGDGDDILMLTVRNEDEPFIGRIPKRFANDNLQNPPFGPVSDPARRSFDQWGAQQNGLPAGNYSGGDETVESQLAEVVWFAVENPTEAVPTFAFGEPGYRTIYRRALLILPDLDYGIRINAAGLDLSGRDPNGVNLPPGVVRVLPPAVTRQLPEVALAGLIAFQERYDLSVRLEWDPLLPGGGRWILKANSLADLTKRENRYEHHGYVGGPNGVSFRQTGVPNAQGRYFPFAVVTGGIHNNVATLNAVFTSEVRPATPTLPAGGFQAVLAPQGVTSSPSARTIVAFQRDAGGSLGRYDTRPFVTLDDNTDRPGTVRAVLNENGEVVHLTSGLAPLGGRRRGDDIMVTDALAFDLRVYDPGAPTYAYYAPGDQQAGQPTRRADQIVAPGDPAWATAYFGDVNGSQIGDGAPVLSPAYPFVVQRQGAYVDLAYGLSYVIPPTDPSQIPAARRFSPQAFFSPQDLWDNATTRSLVRSTFFFDGLLRTAVGPAVTAPEVLTRRYATYDTWSTHYESNGVNEDGDTVSGAIRQTGDDQTVAVNQPSVDEGIDGLETITQYPGVGLASRFGPDDSAERETRPPYDTALRGVQVALRVYERDSRQIREVKVRESFVPE